MLIAPHCKPFDGWRNREGWEPKHPWTHTTYVQWGGRITPESPAPEKPSQAFFEAFVRDVVGAGCIRAEGETVVEAETKCFAYLQRIQDCAGHAWERGEYRNGGGTCSKCGAFYGEAFEPCEICTICGTNTYFGQDRNEQWYCEVCYEKMPRELRPAWMDDFDDIDEVSDADLTESIGQVIEGMARAMDKKEDGHGSSP
jgi:hypothetical protein